MGWYIALALLALLAMLPLGISVRYDIGGMRAKIIAGPIRVKLYPKRPKDQTKKAPKEGPSPQPGNGPKTMDPSSRGERGGSLADILPLVKLALNLLNDLRRKLRVNRLEIKLILAGDDPCDLAVNYGRAWEAVGGLLPQLERIFKIKKRNVEVECDFQESETKIIAHLDITVTLGRVLILTVSYGVRALKEYFKIKDKRKGGAVK